MGVTFLEYQNEIRLSHIYQDLITTTDTLQDILEQFQNALCDDRSDLAVRNCKIVTIPAWFPTMCQVSGHKQCTPDVIHGVIQFFIGKLLQAAGKDFLIYIPT